MRRFLLLALLTACLITLSSCNQRDLQNDFASAIERHVQKSGNANLDHFKQMRIDTSCRFAEIHVPEIDSIYADISKQQELDHFLDSLATVKDAEKKKLYLRVVIHAYLNGEKIFGEKIVSEYRKAIKCHWSKTEKLHKQENARIARKNYESIHIGDSILLNFPVANKGGRKSTFFYLGYPYSHDYSMADDSLLLKAVLLKKYYGEKENTATDTVCLAFEIKIVEMSDTSIEIMNEKYAIGEEYDFCINDYGRIIQIISPR